MYPPEEVVGGLLGGRDFEGGDRATRRVHAGHDVFDGAILARGIHPLQDDEDRVLLLGIKQIVEFLQVARVFVLGSERRFLVIDVSRIVGIAVAQPELLAWAYLKPFTKVVFHGSRYYVHDSWRLDANLSRDCTY